MFVIIDPCEKFVCKIPNQKCMVKNGGPSCFCMKGYYHNKFTKGCTLTDKFVKVRPCLLWYIWFLSPPQTHTTYTKVTLQFRQLQNNAALFLGIWHYLSVFGIIYRNFALCIVIWHYFSVFATIYRNLSEIIHWSSMT